MNGILSFVLGLIVLKCAVQLWLEDLNRRNVLARADAIPAALAGIVDEPTYARTVQYTLAKGRLQRVELIYNLVVLIAVLCSGALPWAYNVFTHAFGLSAWAMAALLFVIA